MEIDSTIVGSFIAGIFAVIAAIVPIVVSKWIRSRRRLYRDLGKILPGNWVGEVVEDEPYKDGENLRYQVDWEIKLKFRRFVSESSARYEIDGETRHDTYTLFGELVFDRFVQFEFENNNESKINFGTEILHVNDEGDFFEGKLVAFVSGRSKIITGTIRANKTT